VRDRICTPGGNNAAWKKLPPELQEIARREFTAAAITEREESQALDPKEMQMMTDKV
jgi:TRAP-type C4-dicarboxylate transport system substrate-binding protein